MGVGELVTLARVLGLLEGPGGAAAEVDPSSRPGSTPWCGCARRRASAATSRRRTGCATELEPLGVVLEDTRDGNELEAAPVTEREAAPLFGRNPVLELLRAAGAGAWTRWPSSSEGRGPALQELLTLARSRQVKVSYRTREQLTAMAGTPHHQGVVARVAEASYASLDDLLAMPGERGEPAFFLALDRVQDPRNLGAVLRTAEATGAHGVILPKHHAAGLTPAAAKSAMGALELHPGRPRDRTWSKRLKY